MVFHVNRSAIGFLVIQLGHTLYCFRGHIRNDRILRPRRTLTGPRDNLISYFARILNECKEDSRVIHLSECPGSTLTSRDRFDLDFEMGCILTEDENILIPVSLRRVNSPPSDLGPFVSSTAERTPTQINSFVVPPHLVILFQYYHRTESLARYQ